MPGDRSPDRGDSARWERLEELLERGMSLRGADRRSFLEDLSARDPALHAELQSLLGSVDRATHYFERLADVAAHAARDMDASVDGAVDVSPVGTGPGRFRIESELGRGGMGVVYRAFDTVLERTIALKFLPSELRADSRAAGQLIAEARAAAALDHANVCTIHEAGTTQDGRVFLAMPCYEGDTLNRRLSGGALPLDEALDCARQIAAGLSAAHAVGLVHRDVKPGNVLITTSGVVKLLDFGIARRPGDPGAWPGLTPGTAAYMAPEQLDGPAVDARADLWALGVVLYEMLTGRNPFAAGDVDATTDAVLHGTIEPLAEAGPGTPAPVAALVMRLLERDPARRIASADEVIAELSRIRAAPARRAAHLGFSAVLLVLLLTAVSFWASTARDEDLRSIAVLPLVNFSGNPEHDPISVALHQQLIAEVGRIETLKVIHRESVWEYVDTQPDIPQVATALGVDGVMLGSVRVDGDSIHLELSLVRAASGRTIWGNSYQTDRSDVLSLPGEAARGLAHALNAPQLRGRAEDLGPAAARALSTQRPRDPAAQESWFRGLYHHSQDMATLRPGGDPDSVILIAIESFEEAVRLEPDWADAHAYLASAYHMYASRPRQFRSDALARSRASALRALTLDPANAHAYGALGFVLMSAFDWEGAERSFRRALELDPNTPYLWSWAIYLQHAGRHDEAIAAYHRAEELNPTYERLKLQVAAAYSCAERHEEAIAQREELLRRTEHRIDSIQWATWRSYIARSYSSLGQHEKALIELERAIDRVGTTDGYLTFLAQINARAGRLEVARAYLTEIETQPGLALVSPEVYAAVGDTATAVRNVEFLFETRSQYPFIFRCTEAYRALKHHPRIQELVRNTSPRR
jgi:eukaryotic-like serine/threonine-protein kinase